MTTDSERREMARRLREIRPCTIGYIKWWKIAQVLGLKEPAGWFGWEKFEPDSVNRLADLIEPVERMCLYYDADTNHCGCYDTRLIDREALLALADNLDSSASMLLKQNNLDSNRKRRGMRRDYAKSLMAASDRIREALGVE